MKDRASFEKANREFLEMMKERQLLGMGTAVTNKDAFILAAALGVNHPEEMQGSKEGLFLYKDLKTRDRAMIEAALIGSLVSDEDIDEASEFSVCCDYCEKCASTGFRVLKEKVLDANQDNELLERKLLLELDHLYTQNVEDDI